MIPNRKVIDISHWNTVSDMAAVKRAGIVGIIHKATEGTGYTDPNYVSVRAHALMAGLKWGAYHWINSSDPVKQAQQFLSVVGSDDDTLYAVDWEDDPKNGTASADQVRRFIEVVETRIGVNRVVVYSGNVAKEKLGNTKDEFFAAHRLWLAQYSSSPNTQDSWPSWWLWQYSDGKHGPGPHGCPGVNGDVDTNSYAGSDQQLLDEWSGRAATAPKPDAPTVSITTTGDVQVILNGKVLT